MRHVFASTTAALALAACLPAVPLSALEAPVPTIIVATDRGPDLRAERAALAAAGTSGALPRPAPLVGPSAGPWLVPFKIDPGNPTGTTTLLAVRNDAPAGAAHVLVEFLDVVLNEFHQVALTLEPDQVQSFNLRDQPGVSSDGLVRVTAEPGELISVDTFRVEPHRDFATGGLGINLPVEECGTWKVRVLVGGPFTGGTTLRFFVNGPQGIDTENDPPTVAGSVYNEAGELRNPFELFTDVWVFDLDAAVLLTDEQLFGSIEMLIQGTEGAGHITVQHSAEGRYSVVVPGVCLEPPI
jgi:hypothetical protein